MPPLNDLTRTTTGIDDLQQVFKPIFNKEINTSQIQNMKGIGLDYKGAYQNLSGKF